jgi:hypothetical protein
MKLLIAALCICLTSPILFAQTTYFQQDFSSSNTVSSYISSSPGIGRFNGINGPDGNVSIVNGTLQFDRLVDGKTGHMSRNAVFSPATTSLYVQFDFEVVSATTRAGSSALIFAVGNSFTNGVGLTASEIYGRFAIGFNGTGYAFTVRNVLSNGSGTNSIPFTGKQTITFVLNNTGYVVTYLQPGGGLKTLPDDTYDLWVGTNRAITEHPVLNPTQAITDFKLRIDDDVYAASFQFDNFLIRDISGVLPVELTRFEATPNGPHVELNWTTDNLLTDSQFTVQRHTGSGEFLELGTLPTQPNQRTYTYTDEQPTPGLNYYRLRQTSAEGRTNYSKLIQVRYEPNQPALLLLENPTNAAAIQVRTYALDAPVFQLTNLVGQLIPYRQHETPEGMVTLLPQQPLPSGVYLLTASSGTTRITKRVLVR